MSQSLVCLISPPPSLIVSMFRSRSALKSGTGRSAFVTRRLWVTIGVAGTEDEAFFLLSDRPTEKNMWAVRPEPPPLTTSPSGKQWQEERICFNSGYKRLSETIENNTDWNANEGSHLERETEPRQRSSPRCAWATRRQGVRASRGSVDTSESERSPKMCLNLKILRAHWLPRRLSLHGSTSFCLYRLKKCQI